MGKEDHSPKGDLYWFHGKDKGYTSFHVSKQVHYTDKDGKRTIINKIGSIKFLIEILKGIFKFYQPTLHIVEQIALLTIWEERCVEEEEYEMAKAVKDMMNYIQKNPNKVPQRLTGLEKIPIKLTIFGKIKKSFVMFCCAFFAYCAFCAFFAYDFSLSLYL